MPDLNAARAQLEKLISFDTTSHLSNLALIAYAEDVLRAAGAETWRVANADGDKANLYALIGPDAPGGVVLSGHTDVVPVDGQAWSSDPWTLTERDGRLYGRGSCDMKGFLACALAAAPDFAAASLKRPIAFALSYDEEIGCIGAPSMIARLKDDLPALEAVIVGEPTEMKVVTAHKGLLSFRVTFTGREAHSSQVLTGVCAVTAAIPFANALVSLAKDLRANAPADTAFDPPFTTLTVGQFHGGTASNILAGQTVIETLARPCPWDDAEEMEAHIRAKAAEVEAEMQKIAPEARVDVHRMSHVPALVARD